MVRAGCPSRVVCLTPLRRQREEGEWAHSQNPPDEITRKPATTLRNSSTRLSDTTERDGRRLSGSRLGPVFNIGPIFYGDG
jgi:hypothetical protein